jgi:hypothetical protein
MRELIETCCQLAHELPPNEVMVATCRVADISASPSVNSRGTRCFEILSAAGEAPDRKAS